MSSTDTAKSLDKEDEEYVNAEEESESEGSKSSGSSLWYVENTAIWT